MRSIALLNVLTLTWEYPPHVVGGLGAHVAHLAPELAQQGVAVHVLAPRLNGGPAEDTDGSLRVSRWAPADPAAGFFDLVPAANEALLAQAEAIVSRHPGPWLVHVHDWPLASAAIGLKERLGLPLLATIHATEHGRNRGIHSEVQAQVHQHEFRLVTEADAVITCSSFMATQVAELFGVPAATISVIPNGVDVDRLDGGEFDRTAFRQLYAGDDERLVLYVGRLVAEKGIYVVLKAIPRVLEVFPRAKFIVAGSGPALADAQRQAAGQPWSERLHFTGFVPDLVRNRLYSVADCATFPSLYEPFGIVALEAMSTGVPVIVSDSGGLTEVVDPEETGVIVQAGSADSLAWGIVHVLEQPVLSRCRAERAAAKARTDFAWPHIATLTRARYEALIAG